MAEVDVGGAGEITVVLTTAPSAEVAARLVRTLVEERLIACGNLVPGLTSVYRWEGEVVDAAEVLILMKTPRALVSRLFERAAQLHPYEVPELVAVAPEAVASAYCRWVRHETIEVSA